MLKFRVSYGQIGDDRTGAPWQEFNPEYRWLYLDRWASGGAFNHAITGVDPADSPYQWYYEASIGNPNIQWEVSTKLDIALDYAFLGGVLAGTLDFFSENRTNILLAGGDRAIPGYYGATPPRANMGEVETKGYELELRWNKPFAIGVYGVMCSTPAQKIKLSMRTIPSSNQIIRRRLKRLLIRPMLMWIMVIIIIGMNYMGPLPTMP